MRNGTPKDMLCSALCMPDQTPVCGSGERRLVVGASSCRNAQAANAVQAAKQPVIARGLSRPSWAVDSLTLPRRLLSCLCCST